MMNGLYFIYSPINIEQPDGIEKKMLAQKRMFGEIGIDMNFELLENKNGTDWNYKQEYSGVDFIYFRKESIVDWHFVSFLKKIKKNGNPVIFMEIPTFPYEGEFGHSLRSRIALIVDHYYRRKLKYFLDRIVVTGFDVGNFIFGVRAVCVVNGVDLKNIAVRSYKPHGDILYLSCIAKFSPWHGYERLIKGLATYYKQPHERLVKILMVGEGVELSYYQQLARDYEVEKYINFYGKLTGKDLDDIYNLTDIGICSLGRYKSGINVIGDLKSRDLMAKGIPMLCGCQIDVLRDVNYEYALYVPNDDSEVCIKKLIVFYAKLTKKNNVDLLTSKIRKEAEVLIDYGDTYKKVLETTKELICK